MRVWSGYLWCLITLFAHLLAGLKRGWSGGRVAIRVAALWHCLSISRCMGKRNAWASRASVGDVLSPPVIANAPALCVVVSFAIALPMPFLCASRVSTGLGVPQTSGRVRGHRSFLLFLCAKSIRASLLYSKRELWSLAHFIAPFGLVIMAVRW